MLTCWELYLYNNFLVKGKTATTLNYVNIIKTDIVFEMSNRILSAKVSPEFIVQNMNATLTLKTWNRLRCRYYTLIVSPIGFYQA